MTVVLAAGGTGGHLFPAVALAREFLRQGPGSAILFVGAGRDIEAKVLTREGFEWEIIRARPVMGRGIRRAAVGLLSLPVGVWQSVKLLRTRRASLVFGIGGYTSPAVVTAAFVLGIPRAILEPNASPGMANRVLAPLADVIFLAFDSASAYFKPSKVRVSGTPVRQAFLEPGAERTVAGPTEGHHRLLVFGGSQGARIINEAMIEALPHLKAMRAQLSIVHQTGEADHERVRSAYEVNGFRAEVVPFLFDMPRALRSATLVVSRSGAVTVAELTACGKAAVLVPLPHAIYQHQEQNARVLEEAGAAVVLRQDQVSGMKLAQVIDSLFRDPGRLQAMGEGSRTLARTDAAEVIVRECMALVKKRSAVSDQPTAER